MIDSFIHGTWLEVLRRGFKSHPGVSRSDRKQKTDSYSVWTTSWDWVFFKGLVLSSSRYLRSYDMHTFSRSLLVDQGALMPWIDAKNHERQLRSNHHDPLLTTAEGVSTRRVTIQAVDLTGYHPGLLSRRPCRIQNLPPVKVPQSKRNNLFVSWFFSDQKKGGKKPSKIEKKRPGIFIPFTIVARCFRFKLVGIPYIYTL